MELIEGGTTHVILGDERPGVVHVLGTVHESGERAAGYTVYVFGTARGERKMPISISRTDEQGVFELDVPRAGDYRFSIGEQQVVQTVFQRHVSGGSRVELSFDMPAGAVHGRVLLPDGSPAPERSVSLTLQHAPGETREFGELRLVRTDANGDFQATALAAGRYRLRATGIGSSFGTGNYSHRVQRDILVHEGETTEVSVQLEHQSIVEGTLLDGDGHPAPGFQVTAQDANGEPHLVWDENYTDANGHFRLLNVPAGRTTVHATAQDGRNAHTEIEVLMGESHTVDLQLQ